MFAISNSISPIRLYASSRSTAPGLSPPKIVSSPPLPEPYLEESEALMLPVRLCRKGTFSQRSRVLFAQGHKGGSNSFL